MKSLKESLFDSNLVSKELPYEKLFKGRISKNDIVNFIREYYYKDNFTNIKNPIFFKWCNDFWNKKAKRYILSACYWVWNPKNDISQEALDWIKPGKIHNKVVWNDVMYANSLNVNRGWWGKEQQWNNITEWILIIEKNGTGYDTYLLANRKEYDEIDQLIIHKMIEILSKK